jgi:hypothetical protein
MTRLVNRRRSAKKSLRKKNMRKSVKHTKRNNRKTRMSHTRKQRGGESFEERVTRDCNTENETNIMNCIQGKFIRGDMDVRDCFATCKPGGEKYIETEEKLAERKRAKGKNKKEKK